MHLKYLALNEYMDVPLLKKKYTLKKIMKLLKCKLNVKFSDT